MRYALNLFAMLIVCVPFFISGCNVQPPIENLHKVRFNNNVPFNIVSLQSRRNNNGLLEIEMVLHSRSWWFDDVIGYQIDWLDGSGFLLKSSQQSPYKSFTLDTNRPFVLKEIATDNRATDFIIHLEDL